MGSSCFSSPPSALYRREVARKVPLDIPHTIGGHQIWSSEKWEIMWKISRRSIYGLGLITNVIVRQVRKLLPLNRPTPKKKEKEKKELECFVTIRFDCWNLNKPRATVYMMMDIYIFSLSIFDWATKKGKRHRERERGSNTSCVRCCQIEELGKGNLFPLFVCVYIFSRRGGKKEGEENEILWGNIRGRPRGKEGPARASMGLVSSRASSFIRSTRTVPTTMYIYISILFLLFNES